MGSNGPVAPPTTGSDAGPASPLLFVISRTDPRASSLAASRASLGALRRTRARARRSAQKVVRREPFVMPSLRVGVLETFRRGAPPALLEAGVKRSTPRARPDIHRTFRDPCEIAWIRRRNAPREASTGKRSPQG